MNDDEKKKDGLQDAALLGTVSDTVKRYGGAIKEHIVSYTGVDNEAGVKLKRSLKSIAQSKVNPDYEAANLKQQAGFAAEVKESANYNAQAKIDGSTVKKVRTDDIGRVNDPLYDHILVEDNGRIVLGSGSQMKFVGGSPKEALDKLMSKGFSKYIENNVDIEVPSDYYQGILDAADADIASAQKQLDRQIASGNSEQAERLAAKIQKLENIKGHLRKSSVSNKEAMLARKHPALSTAKSVAKTANQAGLQGAKLGGAVGGGISAFRNIFALAKDEQSVEEALLNTAKDTALAAVDGYTMTAGASAISGVMKNAASKTINALSDSALPTAIVLVAKETITVLAQYFGGEISGAQALDQLGERGTAMLASGAFATVGQIAIPIPVVGAIIGSMFGYALSTAGYSELTNSLKEAEIARERRVQIEDACNRNIALMKQYQQELNQIINEYMTDSLSEIQSIFEDIRAADEVDDLDMKLAALNRIIRATDKEPLFETREQAIALFNGDKPIII